MAKELVEKLLHSVEIKKKKTHTGTYIQKLAGTSGNWRKPEDLSLKSTWT